MSAFVLFVVIAPSDSRVSESGSAGTPADSSAFQPAGIRTKIKLIPAGWNSEKELQPYFLRLIAENPPIPAVFLRLLRILAS